VILETVQNKDMVAMEDYNRTSQVASLLSMTLYDLEGHFYCFKPL